MKKAFSILFVGAAAVAVLGGWLAQPAPLATPPNVVLIFMDDMGYGDLGCYGASDYQTPNIDRLAAEGMRFTNFLSAQPVCSASRAGLLTGCYPNRIGIYGALFPKAKMGIHANETTMAELLKTKGYATAIFGKWHLGDHQSFLPLQHGFDEYVGLPYSNDMWPVVTNTNSEEQKRRRAAFPMLPIISGNDTLRTVRDLEDQAQLTGLYTKNAVAFIEKNKKKPFFLYLPHSMPHVPIAASAAFRGKTKYGLYGDVIEELDWSVGEIMKTLKKNGLDKNTLVIFTSDNGPWFNYGNHAGSAGGLREGKGTTYEGGNRVPCLMRWAGQVPAGTICTQLASTIDLFPTIAQICQATLSAQKIDGVDISPILKGNIQANPRKYFYYYYRRNSLEAVRRDNWKLILPHEGRTYEGQTPGRDGTGGPAPENHPYPLALFDLSRDPGERYDVKGIYPAIVDELQKVAEEARQDLGDDLTNRTGKNVRTAGILK
jgi:arylsulfatase A-like enzyme